MKTKIISNGIKLLLFFFILNPFAADGSILQWDPASEDATGYRIYYGGSQGTYTNSLDVGLVTQYSMSDLPVTEGATYYFVVRAYNTVGESDNSNEMSWTAPDNTPPAVPVGISYNEKYATLQWSVNSENDLKEYRVYTGTISRNYAPFISVGKETSYSPSGLTEGQTYYLAITAVDNSNNESGYSSEIQITAAFSLSAVPGLAWEARDGDISGYRIYYGTASGSYSSSKDVGIVTQYSFDNLSLEAGVTYYLIVRAYNAIGESDNSNEVAWTISAPPVVDTTKPLIAVSSPTVEAVYQTNSNTMEISGTASDNIGITQISWNSSRGGSGQAAGTTSWVISAVGLLEGENVITIAASDAAGNEGSTILTVNYIPPDTVSPIVMISSPTTGSNFTTSQASIALSGTASDNIGVTQVTWNNSRGGGGNATGTNNWNISNIALVEGENIITVQAFDGAGNGSGRILAVNYIPPDTAAPAINITSPTNEKTYTTNSGSINLSGNASDNIGVTQVRWTNSRGGSDVASGTNNWTVQGVSLAEGDNAITVTARDAAGNEVSSTLNVIYTLPDTIKPVIKRTLPTTGGTYYTKKQTLSISGTASDNKGVVVVLWSNSKGGSGTATGTTNWSVSGIQLVVGGNTITITAKDAAGNSASNSLYVVRR
jgi:fibronectin type 3 domain-containing protein